MEEAIYTFRQQISTCWDDKTIATKFLPRQPDQTPSAGQCTATSYVLCRHLQGAYPDKTFTMMVGEVWHKGQKVIPYHVWVVAQDFEDPGDSVIIDVTADQSLVLPEVIIDPAKTLAAREIYYIAYTPVKDLNLLSTGAQKRAELLAGYYEQLTQS